MVGVSTYDGVSAACIYFQTTRRINAVPTISWKPGLRSVLTAENNLLALEVFFI